VGNAQRRVPTSPRMLATVGTLPSSLGDRPRMWSLLRTLRPD